MLGEDNLYKIRFSIQALMEYMPKEGSPDNTIPAIQILALKNV
jgi:hypothetical protein